MMIRFGCRGAPAASRAASGWPLPGLMRGLLGAHRIERSPEWVAKER
jgi:hypothetical protein